MRLTKKVITQAKFKTNGHSGSLNLDSSSRAALIGRKPGSGLVSGLVGKVAEMSSGQNVLDYGVWLDLSFPHVIGVFGSRGTGKSFTLGVLAECLAGLPEVVSGAVPSAAVVILDVQNQFWTLALSPSANLSEDAPHLAELREWGLPSTAVENVAFWTPSRADEHLRDAKIFKISPKQLCADDWLAILEQDRYSPMGQALITLLQRSKSHNPAELAENAQQSILGTFQSSTVDGLRWRLKATAEMGLIGEPGVDIENLLSPGKISVMLLRNLPENMRALTAGVLSRILAARMSDYHQSRKIARRRGGEIHGGNMPERLWLVMDEAHVIVPGESETPASGPLVDYVKRGRDSGLSLIFATQQPSAVDGKLMSQTDITFTHSLGFDADIQAAAKRMPADASHAYSRDGHKISSLGGVIRALTPGDAIVADSESERIFIQKTRPRLTAHGGNTPESGGEA